MAIHPLLLSRLLIDAIDAKDDRPPAHVGPAVLVGHLPLPSDVTARPDVSTAPLLMIPPPALQAAGLTPDMVAWPLVKRGLAMLFPSTFKIGRDRWCDIVLPDTQVSTLHAQLTLTEDGCRVKDARSMNGTFLNDIPVDAEASLADGDRLRVGTVRMTYLRSETLVKMLRSKR